jgi:hypothetical protein
MRLNSLNRTQIAKYAFCLFVGIVLGLIAMPTYRVVSSVFGGRTVQTVWSDSGHRAVLYKQYSLMNINFKVEVEGQVVYISPDVLNFPDGMYRETLVWDETGRIVVLELMGKRVFAYDAVEKRKLGKGELSQYKLYPTASDYVLEELRDIDE